MLFFPLVPGASEGGGVIISAPGTVSHSHHLHFSYDGLKSLKLANEIPSKIVACIPKFPMHRFCLMTPRCKYSAIQLTLLSSLFVSALVMKFCTIASTIGGKLGTTSLYQKNVETEGWARRLTYPSPNSDFCKLQAPPFKSGVVPPCALGMFFFLPLLLLLLIFIPYLWQR